MLRLTIIAAFATSALGLAIPQTTTTGGPSPPFPTNTTISYFQGDGTCIMPVGNSYIQADYCVELKWAGVSLAQASNHNCSFTLYSGTSSCDGNATEKTSYQIPAGNGTTCVDAGVLDPMYEKASGVWSCN